MATPEQLARQIEQSQKRLDNAIDDRFEQALERIRDIERGIVHVVSGDLQESLTPFGPFRVGRGVIEGRVVPTGIPRETYAEIEEKRHGYAKQTRKAMRGEVALLKSDVAELTARAAEGRL